MNDFQSPDSLNAVAAFHTTFNHPILPTPQIPAAQRAQLRVALLAEELKEMEEAIADNDIVGVADALADLQYVLAGAILEFGLADKFKAIFDEVQRSNMSKSCLTEDEAIATVAYYQQKDGTEAYYEFRDGYYVVYRKADNKTLKNVNYSPAELAPLVLS